MRERGKAKPARGVTNLGQLYLQVRLRRFRLLLGRRCWRRAALLALLRVALPHDLERFVAIALASLQRRPISTRNARVQDVADKRAAHVLAWKLANGWNVLHLLHQRSSRPVSCNTCITVLTLAKVRHAGRHNDKWSGALRQLSGRCEYRRFR